MVTAPALFPCYAPSDAARVGALCDFLEQGAGVKIFRPDGEIGAGETILSKAEEALSADVILLCLSPAAIPPRWDRAQWEPVLFTQPKAAGVELATVLIEECKFPELLRRRNFFDLTRDPLPGFRLIKRWLLELRPPPLEPAFVAVPQPSFVGRDMEIEALQRRL
ncbi:MAG: toll/interleukin-1 receptor domain-containing protein, partial [Candidatus Solibacter usitatus]|nr:toll/interleukin-1 receptor domain-containing protein [Candidatus Solibacter usitatus]